MDIKNVPQDDISTYAKNKKAIYATDENGHYSVVASSGWDVEGEATLQALDELQQQASTAYQEVKAGNKSPLYYHMYAQRMDLTLLAQSMAIFQWRIKRHFNPKTFNRLNDNMLSRYSDVLGISIEVLKQLPEEDKN
ncbi:MAG: hypothetical protein GY951_11015 [Psychromonas sp.]|nr:hypothetical protein [Psychromonas sp.]